MTGTVLTPFPVTATNTPEKNGLMGEIIYHDSRLDRLLSIALVSVN